EGEAVPRLYFLSKWYCGSQMEYIFKVLFVCQSTAICSSRYCCLLFQEGSHVRFVKEAADSVMILKQQLLQSTTTTERVRDSRY
ncbi:hypothetical protein Tco_1493623, partial [Tanacetum coccineum]